MSVSVVIPTYNRADRVLEAIGSALAQQPAPLEVLVCDNASTDDTVARVAALGDSRVRMLPMAANSGGPAAPRNLGIREALGEWVAFLDDDDRWLPGKLAQQSARFDTADLIAGNALRRSDGQRYFATVPAAADLARDNVIITSSAVVRTALLRDVGGFPERPSWQGVEDYATWLALADRGALVAILDEALVDYRDVGADRFGAELARRLHRQLAALHARRWARRPLDPRRARIAASAAVTWLRG